MNVASLSILQQTVHRLFMLWSSCISHTLTMSHWSSRVTVCSPPQGAAIRALGVQPTLWNWDYVLVLSHYSGDPNVIPDHWLQKVLFARSFSR
jgi:hypothetical protein